jgi:hypothetical protein
MQTLLGDACPPMAAVRDRLLAHFSNVCKRGLEVFQSLETSPLLPFTD